MENENSGITERFEYNTSILTSYDGHEQRIMTRQYPRHFVTYEYSAMSSDQAQWLRAQLRARTSDVVYVPMWHNVAFMTETHYGGSVFTIDDTYMYAFDNCDAIEIFKKDDAVGTANLQKVVRRYDSNAIVTKTAVDKEYDYRNTYIYPLLRCVQLSEESELNYIFSNGSDTAFTFEDLLYQTNKSVSTKYTLGYNYSDLEDFNHFNLPETLNSREVLLNTPQWIEDSDNALTVTKSTNRLDNTSGIFKYDLKNSRSYDNITVKVLLKNKTMIFNMIKFFKNHGGMFKSFYCPSWVNDFNVYSKIEHGTNYFITEINRFYKYYLGNTRHKKIVIFFKNGTSEIYDISTYGYTTIDGVKYGKVYIQDTFEKDISVDSILMVSFLNLVRFNSDVLTIDYETTEVATVTLEMKEVDDDE